MQVQEAARAKVVRAFKIALHHMDEETLMTKMAASLQLVLSPQQEATVAADQHSGLQAPQTLHCPKKARSSRCRRPASAASQGMAKLPSLSRPLSAPAERSGLQASTGVGFLTFHVQKCHDNAYIFSLQDAACISHFIYAKVWQDQQAEIALSTTIITVLCCYLPSLFGTVTELK